MTNALENVYCPVCNYKCASLPHLVEHLAQDNCQSPTNVHTIIFERRADENCIDNSPDIADSEIKIYQSGKAKSVFFYIVCKNGIHY